MCFNKIVAHKLKVQQDASIYYYCIIIVIILFGGVITHVHYKHLSIKFYWSGYCRIGTSGGLL
jgi:hypothetical protein